MPAWKGWEQAHHTHKKRCSLTCTGIGREPTHSLLSSSFLGLPYRILYTNHKKELLRSLWVRLKYEPLQAGLDGQKCEFDEASSAGGGFDWTGLGTAAVEGMVSIDWQIDSKALGTKGISSTPVRVEPAADCNC